MVDKREAWTPGPAVGLPVSDFAHDARLPAEPTKPEDGDDRDPDAVRLPRR
jgi:hypothetical protein